MIVCEGCGALLPPSGATGRPRRFCPATCRARAHRRRHHTADHRGDGWALYVGDARAVLPSLAAASVHSILTSPPYWSARDYGGPRGQLGYEATVGDYVAALAAFGDELARVLRPDGTLWLVIGDGYSGHADTTRCARGPAPRPSAPRCRCSVPRRAREHPTDAG